MRTKGTRSAFPRLVESAFSPIQEDDHESSDFEVDYDFFNEKMWPNLAHRIPAFECVKVRSLARILTLDIVGVLILRSLLLC